MSAGPDLRHARSQTAAMLVSLEQDLAALMAAAEGSNADDEHDPEGATLAFERQQLIAVIALTRTRLHEHDEAIARLGHPDWGRCKVCGQPIGEQRLAARPSATRCVSCAAHP